MAHASLGAVLSYVFRLGGRAGETGEGDAQLLRQFVAHRDEAAFAALVGRYGSMVWSTCTRLLPVAADAEDAFQATFLVLVKKAGSIRRPELLGPWLHGVAVRTAAKLRVAAARRRRMEEGAAVMRPTTEPTPDVWHDLRPVLDEEVNNLPEKFRAPFILCHLEGVTNEEAARRLGCPKGTVLSRLARARERLRKQLARRGIILSAGLLASALAAGTASATVPPALAETTVRLGLAWAAGTAPVASSPTISLAEGVLRSMFLTRIKLVAAVLLMLCLAGSGVRLLARNLSAADETPRPVTDKVDPPAGKTDDRPPPRVEEVAPGAPRALRDILKTVVKLPEADNQGTTLGDVLQMFKYKFDVRFDLNEKAFKAAGVAAVSKVPAPSWPEMEAPMADVLRKVLDSLPVDATFVLRKHAVEITTADALRAELGIPTDRRLPPLLYDEEFKDASLATVLRSVSDSTGVSIVLDRQKSGDGDPRVTARFQNVPVEEAVRVLARITGLRAVRVGNVLVVTTPERARDLLAEEAEIQKSRSPAAPPVMERPKEE